LEENGAPGLMMVVAYLIVAMHVSRARKPVRRNLFAVVSGAERAGIQDGELYPPLD
jgi:hypothetical protein